MDIMLKLAVMLIRIGLAQLACQLRTLNVFVYIQTMIERCRSLTPEYLQTESWSMSFEPCSLREGDPKHTMVLAIIYRRSRDFIVTLIKLLVLHAYSHSGPTKKPTDPGFHAVIYAITNRKDDVSFRFSE